MNPDRAGCGENVWGETGECAGEEEEGETAKEEKDKEEDEEEGIGG